MRTKYLWKFLTLVGVISLLFTSCEKDDSVPVINDLFRPVAYADPSVTDNNIVYLWYGITGAVDYTFELSRDTFKTIDRTVTQTTTKYIATDLKYDKDYQARVRSNAPDPDNTSAWYVFNSAKTARRIVPEVIRAVLPADIKTNSTTVRWNSGYKVSRVVLENVFNAADRKEVQLTATDITNLSVTVTGLTAKSTYRATIYDDSVVEPDNRNFNSVKFKTAIEVPTGATRVAKGADLADLIGKAAEGAVFYLEDGYTYKFAAGITISKGVTLLGAPTRPVLTTTGQWTPSGNLSTIRFDGIDFVSEGSNTYLFNPSNAFTLDNFIVNDCTFDNFSRSIFRVQGADGTQSVNTISFNDCVFKNGQEDYYITHISGDNTFKNVSFTNCTFYNLKRGLIQSDKSTVTSATMKVESCTFYDVFDAYYMIRHDNANVAVTLSKCLFSKSKAAMSSVRSLGQTSVADCFGSGDYSQGTNYQITITPITTSPTGADMFVDPAKLDLRFKDINAEALNVGDPRWLP
ncbi:MAG: DUF5123 domain-containing protein [Rikenellaceae bacterium]|nr:DUF5123 domain-containing protein [Rikenellaceae bacterium]